VQSFNELTLSPPLMRAITELGYDKPTPVQALALPMLLEGPTDFLGLAATGTGKTAAFAIPMLERIDPTKRVVQTLILCPTRELAVQVAGQIDLLGKYKNVKALPVYGGASYSDQIHGLKQGAKVVVGTPGRVIDHIERGTLRLDDVTTVILDEADEMISMGFREDIEKVLSSVKKDQNNIWLFSATMSRDVRKVADQFLKDPKLVQINRTEMLPSTIEQLYYMTHESNKPDILCKLIDAAEDFYGLIFCQTKSLVADLTTFLTERGYKVDCLHGDKDQKSRERTMQSFRDRKVKMLVCTDVASRGLDVKDITHVINYSIPRELDSYVHRIGRTARSGKTGFAMSLVTPSHRRLIMQIENMTKSRMKEGTIPTRKDVGTKKTGKVLATFLEQNFHARATEVLDDAWKTAIAAMTPEEITGRFITMMFPDIFNERDIQKPARTESAPRDSRSGSYGGGPDRRGPRRDSPREGGYASSGPRSYGAPRAASSPSSRPSRPASGPEVRAEARAAERSTERAPRATARVAAPVSESPREVSSSASTFSDSVSAAPRAPRPARAASADRPATPSPGGWPKKAATRASAGKAPMKSAAGSAGKSAATTFQDRPPMRRPKTASTETRKSHTS
jgi:ATP-dependent RNA helicase DeaD